MSFNISAINKVLSIAKTIKSPKALLNKALDELSKKNPKAGALIRNAIANGKDPKSFIVEQAQSGTISLKNLETLKQYYALAQNFGLSQNIPDTVWQEAEQAIRQGTQQPVTHTSETPTGFTGF